MTSYTARPQLADRPLRSPPAPPRSMTCVGLIYMVVGISGYLAFPQHVDSNILVTFPEDDPLLKVTPRPVQRACVKRV